MASQGPNFPGTAASLSNAGTSESSDAWVSPGNVSSDNASEAQITAASYDSPDISQILVASNFSFTIPAGATIDGVTVEVDRRSIIANSGKDFRVQLATGTTFATLVGSNKAVPATIWPTTSTVATYGGAADGWSASLTAAQVNATGFAVFLSCQANIANADIGVDFIRVTVNYTETSITVTPTTASLTTATFAPTVTSTQHQTATPGVVALTLTTFEPTVTVAAAGVTATPEPASLTTATFAPTVTASDHQLVTSATASLTTATFAPTVSATNHQTVTPSPASLAMTAFAPNVVASDHKLVTPDPASLTLTTFAPSVGQPVSVTPTTASLALTAFAPDVVLTDHKLVTPELASLVLTAFAPTVAIGGDMTVVPDPAVLVLTAFAPVVTTTGDEVGGSVVTTTVDQRLTTAVSRVWNITVTDT